MDLLQRLIAAAATTPAKCPLVVQPPKGSIALGALPDHLKGVLALTYELHEEGKDGVANDVMAIITRSLVAQESVAKLKAERKKAGKPPFGAIGVAADWQAYAMEARPRLSGVEIVVLGDGPHGFDLSSLFQRR